MIDESKEDVMDVIMKKQKECRIKDIQLQEISTEEVIKKIYGGEEASSDASAKALVPAASDEKEGGAE